MTKNKLRNYAEVSQFPNCFEFEYKELEKGASLKSNWGRDFFKNDNPITLELGCGKGEYSVGLAKMYPNRNFIGVDINGARIWRGAKDSLEQGLTNICFLRTRIDFIDQFFAPGEVSEIWITFPDPQMQKPLERKRLTNERFLKRYANILSPNHVIHLKTDNDFFYNYTLEVIARDEHHLHLNSSDLYNSEIKDDVIKIQTYYENKYLAEGKNINYIRFSLKS